MSDEKQWIDPDTYIENGIYYVVDIHGGKSEVTHKGQHCVIINAHCSEGLCSNCYIFKSERR